MYVMRHLPISGLSLPSLPPNVQRKIIIVKGPANSFKFPPMGENCTAKTVVQTQNTEETVNRPVNSVTLYCCSICMKGFYEECELKSHIEEHSKTKSLICKLCFNGFIMESAYERHLKKHNPKKPYICNMCRKSYAKAYQLSSHRLKHSELKYYRCSVCTMGFPNSKLLEVHLKVHLRNGDLCNICEKVYSRDFEYHLCTYSGSKPKVCGMCDEVYFCLTSYKNHVQGHSQDLQLLTNTQNIPCSLNDTQ